MEVYQRQRSDIVLAFPIVIVVAVAATAAGGVAVIFVFETFSLAADFVVVVAAIAVSTAISADAADLCLVQWFRHVCIDTQGSNSISPRIL